MHVLFQQVVSKEAYTLGTFFHPNHLLICLQAAPFTTWALEAIIHRHAQGSQLSRDDPHFKHHPLEGPDTVQHSFFRGANGGLFWKMVLLQKTPVDLIKPS